MAGASNLFGGSDAIRQILLWQVAGQLIAPVLAPVANAIAMHVWENATSVGGGVVSVPLSPAEAALGVLRGNIDPGTGASIAGKSGVDGDDFQRLVDNTGEPISTQEALYLERRGKIDRARLERAIRQSRVRNEWIDAVEMLSEVPLSVSDAVDAVVENQITYPEGARIASWAGVSEPDFRILTHTRGRPPGPVELLEMVRRGFIPTTGTGPDALSLEQGISESAIKDKWIPVYYHLLEYRPPPRTITALERSAAITPAQAQQMYQEAGLSPELAAAYSHEASHTKLAKQREITEAQVLGMYREHFLDTAAASGLLNVLGYTQHEIDLLLAWEDARRELAAINQALSQLRTLYVARKIGTTTLHAAFGSLGVSSAQQDELLRIWTLERNAKHSIITAAQIATGLQHAIIDQATAQSALEDLGYTPWDAWFYLSQHLHSALEGEPPRDASVTGQAP